MVSKTVGKFLYYYLALYSTILVALKYRDSTQAKATEQTYNDIVLLLNYASIHPAAVVSYKKINVIMWVHSDVSYLLATKARSRTGVYHYLSDDS